MKKAKMHTPNLTQENIARIRELFPNCVTEIKDPDAKPDAEVTVKYAIDFDLLKQELSGHIVEGPVERYQLNWPGKREALLAANAPIAKTLRPVREESVNFDTTENLFIEGDNLDALKLLQETYLGKVKMIYIDPPYNTGSDFIYNDDFAENSDEYLVRSNQKDEEGNRLIANSESNGRFHSDWLSMMYPRLKLARNLLSDDGVIFISIDDGEVHNLRKACDEIFGERNFVATLVWNTDGHTDNQLDVKVNHEYVLLYSKDRSSAILQPVVDPNTRKESNLWKGYAENSITKNGRGNPPSEVTLPVGFPCAVEVLRLPEMKVGPAFFAEVATQGWISRSMTDKWNITYPVRLDEILVSDSVLQKSCRVYSGWANVNKLKAFIENNCEPLIEEDGELSFYLSEKGVIYYLRKRAKASNILSVLRNFGTTERMRSELEDEGLFFDYPKPKELLRYLGAIGSADTDIVLDFFAGSATTAHAVMQLNAEDGGNRKFILVQLPEECEPKSEAFKAGYTTIADIAKERIRRAGKKIQEELNTKDAPARKKKKQEDGEGLFDAGVAENGTDPEAAGKASGSRELDIGFRVLKVDSSCMVDVYYTPDQTNQSDLTGLVENIKSDRTEEDLLFQVLLDWGVDLTLPIVREKIEKLDVFFVDRDSLAACFAKDGKITERLVEQIAERSPMRVVFRDAGFKSDSVRINVEQIFKQKSPETEIRTI